MLDTIEFLDHCSHHMMDHIQSCHPKKKYFYILTGRKNQVISTDILKPAFMTSASLANDLTEKTLINSDPISSYNCTRIGRKVRFPD